MCEGGLINALVMGMNHGLDREENIDKKKSMLMVYLMQYRKVIREMKILSNSVYDNFKNLTFTLLFKFFLFFFKKNFR